MKSVFCEIYGDTIRNQILEYFMENQDIDAAVCDIVKDTCISKPKIYETIKEFEKKNYIKKSRIIGKTQLYRLNKQDKIVKLFLDNFRQCLHIICQEHSAKRPIESTESKAMAAKC